MDNLATHSPAALYHTFPPGLGSPSGGKVRNSSHPTAWELARALAEIEFSVLARQCLARRIATVEELEREVQAWQEQRNVQAPTITWRFTTADARIKLRRLYPTFAAKQPPCSQSPVAKEV
jgi:hypothetical protein